MKKKVFFIINPRSGTSKKQDLNKLIDQYLDHDKFDYSISYTEYAGHAIELSKKAIAEQYDVLAICGGDGSVNEVSAPLVDPSLNHNYKTKIAIIPGGSGNGFASHFRISRNPIKAIKTLNAYKVERVDSCTINNKCFVNIAGVGFDGLVSYRIKDNAKRGLWMYLKVSFKEMIGYHQPIVDIQIDDHHIQGQFASVAICNASVYGYNFTMAPDANVKDGLMDIVMIRKAPLWAYLFEAYRFLNKTMHKSKYVSVYKAKNITLSSDETLYYHTDGEGYQFEGDLLHFEIKPQSLDIISAR